MKYITTYMQKALFFFAIFSIQSTLIKAEIPTSELPFFQTPKVNTPEKQTAEPLFNIDLSDEQLKELDITPDSKEAQELRDFVSMLNKLSPEEQNMMAQLGKEIETKMKEDGLDPLNPDDITKWAEAQAQETPPAKNMFAQKTSQETESVEKLAETPKEPIIVAIPEDIRNMLLDLVKHLASLRQKAATYPDMAQKLERWHNELNQLTYLLHVLTSPDLLKHLASINFTPLRKNLEKLYIQLATYEPVIILHQPLPDEDDPYRVLGINYTATPAEIKERFNQLRSELHPDIVTQQLEEEKDISEKARQKRIKESRLFFKFIQDAYDTLKNTKQRAQIDRLLRESKSLEHKANQNSIKAFYNIFDELNSAFYHNNILGNIHTLLAQYKPEELAQAKAQEALEKKAYERSKQPQSAPRSTRIYQPERGQWDEFYRQMAQERSSRSFRSPYSQSSSSNYNKPFIPNATMSDTKSSISTNNKKPGQASATGQEQRSNIQSEDKKNRSENQDHSKAKEPVTPEQTQEKTEKAGYITALARLLDKATDEVTIEQPLPTPKTPAPKKSPEKPKDIEILMQEDGIDTTQSNEILAWIDKHPQKEELFSYITQDLKEDMAQEGLDISNPTDLISWIKSKNPLKEEQLLNDITQKIDAKVDAPQKKQSKASLKSIMGSIDKLLVSAPTKQPSQQTQEKAAIANLKAFFKQNKLEQIWELLLALNPANNAKIDDPTLQKLWKEKIFDPHGARIKSWFGTIYPALNSSMRYSAHKPPILPAKLKSYSLDKPDLSTSMPELQAKAQLNKLKASLKDKADISLAVEKGIIKGISTFFSAITKSLGIKGDPPKPPIIHGPASASSK